jgi:hypothetical protein
MGQVIQLANEAAVDTAWESYAQAAGRLADNPRLLTDRAFNEELARLHERWKRLFLVSEAGR